MFRLNKTASLFGCPVNINFSSALCVKKICGDFFSCSSKDLIKIFSLHRADSMLNITLFCAISPYTQPDDFF